MSQFFQVHPENPQLRLIRRAVDVIRDGGLVVYPTDSCYALGCQIGDKAAMERIRRIRKADKSHHFTLVCRDLSEIATYARVDNRAYRLLRAHTPGPYTFILRATSEVPNRLRNPRRKTIGIRVPDHAVPQLMLTELGEPIMSSTLTMPGDEYPLSDPVEIRERLEHQVEAIIDAGSCGMEPSSIIDLGHSVAQIIRRGKGDLRAFEASDRSLAS
ncbi:MAG: threonylcarbamoyl-AMP synthase [Gammaproteobacteria bacterium]|nr:threonylcarbamoyl-AMP synthase [Gammaproteobacteria bacterium]